MSSNLKMVLLIGRIGNDPEYRNTQSGDMLATFSVATNDWIKDKDTGESKSVTEWHKVVVYNQHLINNVLKKMANKGTSIYIQGQIRTRKWKDQNDVDKEVKEVVVGRFAGDMIIVDSTSSSLNSIMLIGRIGNDPEYRNTQSGDMLATFSVATNDWIKDKDTGESKSVTEWHKVVVYNQHLINNVLKKMANKGTSIYIQGQIRTRKWKDQNDVDKEVKEVVVGRFAGSILVLGKPSSEEDASANNDDVEEGNTEDDIPF